MVGGADGEVQDGGRPGIERWRGAVTRSVALLSIFSASAAWLLERAKGDPDSFEQFGLPAIALLALAAGAFPRAVWRRNLQVVLLAGGAVILLERIYTTLHEDLPGLEPYVNAYEVIAWFPLVYLFGFTLLSARQALFGSLGLIAAGASVIWLAVQGRPELATRVDLLEIAFANVGCVMLILALSRLKEQWAAARAEAVTLRRMAETDYLTGLPNRREATARVGREVHRSLRYGSPLALLLLDLDHFKGVNDRFGHATGDRALVRAANLLRSALRSTDVCGRWGGEEFLVALPGVDLPGALDAAERLRLDLATATAGAGPALTASIGVTALAPGDNIDALLLRADAALYQAKRAGRDCVKGIPPPEPLVAVGAA